MDTVKLTIDGRAIFGNHDYDVKLDLSYPGVGYIRGGYTEFRSWYDGNGGFFPGNGQFFAPPQQEMTLDRGEAWIELDSHSRRVTGSGGCNRINGDYSTGRDSLRFGRIVATMMACPDMATEQKFVRVLNDTRRYRATTTCRANAGAPKARSNAYAPRSKGSGGRWNS
jgi:hypothetical protein